MLSHWWYNLPQAFLQYAVHTLQYKLSPAVPYLCGHTDNINSGQRSLICAVTLKYQLIPREAVTLLQGTMHIQPFL